MNRRQLLALLKRYEAGTCSDAERLRLERWFAKRVDAADWQWESPEDRLLVQRLMRERIERRLFAQEKKQLPHWKIVAAASILLCLSVGAWFFLDRGVPASEGPHYAKQAVTPGSQAAFLTLADGSTIRLDDAQPGTFYNHAGVAIKKHDDGALSYDVDAGTVLEGKGTVPTNTIAIPRGGQYRLTLPDGSTVRLNSGSTLVYPVAFTGRERSVILTGEAYFEISKDRDRPFRVKAGDTEVQVTGTHFNITAYPDEEQVTTTLVEGGVDIVKQGQKATLRPGQQAISRHDDGPIQVGTADTDYALAWLEGHFVFENQDIKTIMQNIARWYDVDVVYANPTPASRKAFGGTYTKSKGIAELLAHLETLSNHTIRFELAERRVTVTM